MKVTTDAVQVLGGYGYMKEYPVEKLLRDAKLFRSTRERRRSSGSSSPREILSARLARSGRFLRRALPLRPRGCLVVGPTSARERARAAWTRFGAFGLLLVVLVGIGLLFSGSPGRLAHGTRIAGVDVSGLTPAAAEQLLSRRAARLQGVPVTFVVGSKHVAITPRALGVNVDWHAAVAAAERQGGGFAPLRGYRRLALRLFPGNRTPTPRVSTQRSTTSSPWLRNRWGLRTAKQARASGPQHLGRPGTIGHALAQQAAAQGDRARAAGFSRKPVALRSRTTRPA